MLRLLKLKKPPAGKMKMVKLEEKEISISNLDGDYSAFGDICTVGGDLSRVFWKATQSLALSMDQNSM